MGESSGNGNVSEKKSPNKKFKILVEGKTHNIEVYESPSKEPGKLNLKVVVDEKPITVDVEVEAGYEEVRFVAPQTATAAPSIPAETTKPVVAKNNQIASPMPGKILSLLVDVGDYVNAGEAVMILEAMKMENEIRAPRKGKVAKIFCKVGDSVGTGDVLAEFA